MISTEKDVVKQKDDMTLEEHYTIDSGLSVLRFVMPVIESNMYVACEGNSALVVDPNENEEAIIYLHGEGVKEVTILLTHEHIDHISGVNRFRREFDKVNVICSKQCAERIGDPSKNMAKFWDVVIMDKPEKVIEIGNELIDRNYFCDANITYEEEYGFFFDRHRIRMVVAPGHSPGGSLIFVDEEVVFTGDNLVEGNGVITRFPGGRKKEYLEITKPILEGLKEDIIVLPGHGKPDNMGNMRSYLVEFRRNGMKKL